VKAGATADVIGITDGSREGAESTMAQNCATVACTPAFRSAGERPSISGSYSPTWSQ